MDTPYRSASTHPTHPTHPIPLLVLISALSSGLSGCSRPETEASSSTTTPSLSAVPKAAQVPSFSTPLADAELLAGLAGEDLDWAKKCLEGNGDYCTTPGNNAELVARDMNKATAWYKKGCEASQQRSPVCCMALALKMIHGQGTPIDVEGGLKLWESTCSMKHGRNSCAELATAYAKGTHGVTKDEEKAKAISAKVVP